MLNFFKETGTKIPNKPATIMFNIIETAIKIDKSICLNQNCTMTAAMIAKITPFNTPITNSLVTILKKLPEYAMPFGHRDKKEKDFLGDYEEFINQSPLNNVEKFENFYKSKTLTTCNAMNVNFLIQMK